MSLPTAPSLFKPSSFDRDGRVCTLPSVDGTVVVTGMALGKTAQGPRAEKEEGWSEVGVRDLTAEGEGEGGSISAHLREGKGEGIKDRRVALTLKEGVFQCVGGRKRVSVKLWQTEG